jgi:RhtB (resistance to homoserine/threonine) family protein
MDVDLLPFLAISALLILMPGPDTAMVMKNAVVGGRRSGLFASLGVSVGLTIWTIAAAFGIAALLRASEVAFTALKLVGAIYLVWIGIQMLRSRDLEAAATRAGHGVDTRGLDVKAFRQGLLSDLGNPKVAIFFTSFLPQFVHGSGPAFVPLLMLGLMFAGLTLLWLVVYSGLIGRATALVRRSSWRRGLDRFTGVVLIGFGVTLAFERR